jgi:hypothetical protein
MQNLADQLRNSLNSARANERIRERLQELASDPKWLESIEAELGARHGLVRELRALVSMKVAA